MGNVLIWNKQQNEVCYCVYCSVAASDANVGRWEFVFGKANSVKLCPLYNSIQKTIFPLKLRRELPNSWYKSSSYTVCVCVNDFCLVNSTAGGQDWLCACMCVCVCVSDWYRVKKKDANKREKRKMKDIRVVRGVLGGLGPSVAKPIHFQPSSVAHFIQMHTCGVPLHLFSGQCTIFRLFLRLKASVASKLCSHAIRTSCHCPLPHQILLETRENVTENVLRLKFFSLLINVLITHLLNVPWKIPITASYESTVEKM